MSQEALAVDTGIDRTRESRLERGIENAAVAVLEKIAAAPGARVPRVGDRPARR